MPEQASHPIDLLFQLGTERLQQQFEIFQAADTKIGVILGFVVVSIAELLGFLLLAAAENVSPNHYFSCQITSLFVIGLVSAIGATFTALVAMWGRSLSVGPEISDVSLHLDENVDQLRISCIQNILKSIELNRKAIETKQRYAKIEILLVVVTLCCYTAITILLFLSLSSMRHEQPNTLTKQAAHTAELASSYSFRRAEEVYEDGARDS